MISLLRPIVLFAGLLAALAGCDLPQGAGNETQILAGADSPDATFAVHPVTRASLPQLASWPVTASAPHSGWIGASRGPSGQIIEPGDRLDVTIWDNEVNSLLISPGEKVVSLSGLTVSQSGSIFLPYVSEVYVAKMSPDEARQAIQARMAEIGPSVQVQLNHASGRQNSVDVVSGVNRPGTLPLLDRDTSALSVIAQAGGVAGSLRNPQVRLMRDGRLYGISLDQLLKNPGLDTTLRGGDKLFVEPEERYFVALGASTTESRVPFPSDTVTALDAISLAGGLDERRANPSAILLLRSYPASALRADGRGPDRERVIFTFDLTDADGLFSANAFQVQHKDVVIATESPITAAQVVIGLVTSAVVLNNAATN
jgi:polysaccharide export outer membrane protein